MMHVGHDGVGFISSLMDFAEDVPECSLVKDGFGELLRFSFVFNFLVEGIFPTEMLFFGEAVLDGFLFLLDVFF